MSPIELPFSPKMSGELLIAAFLVG
ncbi:hypothetical protein XBO1_2530028 [Xenorhabdus bovienii str. oregonense]|uniref:Uncharacterized protein n=1 Tax=Xenorhabdus bovienii str. oregonense TaxID=1398202 RepID=A0A077P8B0_XENBV|nr:hypothetical protein XBO1_2530028 [Xenorhabdus bovienii str. oregonense]